MSHIFIWIFITCFSFSLLLFPENLKAEDPSSSSYRDQFNDVEREKQLKEGKEDGAGGSKGGKTGRKKKKADDVNLIPSNDPFLSFVSLEQSSLIAVAKNQSLLEAQLETLWKPLDVVSNEETDWLLGERENTLDSQIQSELITQLGWFGGGSLATPPNLSGVIDHQIGQSIPYPPLPRASIGSAKLTSPDNSVLSKWELLGEIYGKEFALALVDTLDDIAVAAVKVANGGVALQANVYNPEGIFFDQPIAQVDTSKPWYNSLYTKPLNRKTTEEAIRESSGGLFEVALEKKGGRVAKELVQRHGGSALKWVIRLFPLKANAAWDPHVMDDILSSFIPHSFRVDWVRGRVARAIDSKMETLDGLPVPDGFEERVARRAAGAIRKGSETNKFKRDARRFVDRKAHVATREAKNELEASLAAKVPREQADNFFAALTEGTAYTGKPEAFEAARKKLLNLSTPKDGKFTGVAEAAQHILDGHSPYPHGQYNLTFHSRYLDIARNRALAFLHIVEEDIK